MKLNTYYLIYLDFSNGKYTLYEYQKERKLTTRQINDNIFNNNKILKIIEQGILTEKDTIKKHYDLIEKYNINPNNVQRLWSL